MNILRDWFSHYLLVAVCIYDAGVAAEAQKSLDAKIQAVEKIQDAARSAAWRAASSDAKPAKGTEPPMQFSGGDEPLPGKVVEIETDESTPTPLEGAYGPEDDPAKKMRQPVEEKYAVPDMRPEELENITQKEGLSLVLFYAPWDFGSRQMLPIWDNVAMQLNSSEKVVKVTKLNAHRFNEAAEKEGISDFPSVLLYVDGEAVPYDMSSGHVASAKRIVSWVMQKTGSLLQLRSAEDLDRFLQDSSVAVVGIFPDGASDDRGALTKAAHHFDRVVFGEVRGSQDLCVKVAADLSYHLEQLCTSVHVGVSATENRKLITMKDVPNATWHCSDKPQNPQGDGWTDSFKTEVQANILVVTRTDQQGGWGQSLRMKCCADVKASAAKKVHVPVPSIAMVTAHSDGALVYDDDMTNSEKLQNWITDSRIPSLIDLSYEDEFRLAWESRDKRPLLLFADKTDAPIRDLPKLLQDVTQGKHKGKVRAALVGKRTVLEGRIRRMLGIEEKDTAAQVHLVSGVDQTTRKFHFYGNNNVPELERFVSDFFDNKLVSDVKSEPKPETEAVYTGSVRNLVGTTFLEAVQNAGKDVLVNVFAPWCGHCQKFKPLYQQLGKKLKHVKTLDIAQIDGTQNELEGQNIQSYPTILFFPGGPQKKHIKEYEGDRTVDDMVRFLKAQCHFSFNEHAPPTLTPPESDSGLLGSEDDL